MRYVITMLAAKNARRVSGEEHATVADGAMNEGAVRLTADGTVCTATGAAVVRGRIRACGHLPCAI